MLLLVLCALCLLRRDWAIPSFHPSFLSSLPPFLQQVYPIVDRVRATKILTTTSEV